MRFAVLDGWRGVAALSVALFHLRALGHFYDDPFVRHAFLFVDFFFVLSGFILAHAYRERLNTPAQLKYFVIQRFGRIYPLHVAIVLLLILVECVRGLAQWRSNVFSLRTAFTGDASPLAILSNLFLAHGLGVHDHLTLNGPSWSISVEFWTYLVFALVCLGTGMRTKATAATAALLACGGAMAVALCSTSFIDTTYDFGMLRCVYGFFVGVLTYLLYKAVQPLRLSRPAATVCELLAVAGVVAFVSLAGGTRWSLGSPLLFAAVVGVFAFETGVVSDWFTTKPIALLGLLSYSIYMIHYVVLLFLHQGLTVVQKVSGHTVTVKMMDNSHQVDCITAGGPWMMDALALVYLGIVVACAAITYHFIEDPGRRYFHRLATEGLRFRDRNRGRRVAGATCGEKPSLPSAALTAGSCVDAAQLLRVSCVGSAAAAHRAFVQEAMESSSLADLPKET